MKSYFDPVYGNIELKPIAWDLLTKCSELKRLRYIGMMNFKSLSMLPLTTITRLEHTIGLTYLTQIFCESNKLNDLENDLIVASLYHDVNCGSFGHAVEWAIDRHVDYEHEADIDWVKSDEALDQLKNKPIFLEQDGLHRFNFGEKYSLNFNAINDLINGSNCYFINNSGIDLDNIDNVFRMAHYFGFNLNKHTPVDLVKSLKYNKKYDNFIVETNKEHLIKTWLETRSKVYKKFIYSEEYMGFEYLVYKLISTYASSLEHEIDVKNIFHLTDERLLWNLYAEKKTNKKLSKIAKKLLLHEIPYCHGILRSSSYHNKEKFDNISYLTELENNINQQLNVNGNSSSVYIHMTTDNRKTNRKIEYYCIENAQTITPKSIGEDKKYILLGILGNKELSDFNKGRVLKECVNVLNREEFNDFDVVTEGHHEARQLSLF